MSGARRTAIRALGKLFIFPLEDTVSKIIADAIARDILTERPRSPEAQTCFLCARPYSKGDGRFCSTKCRSAYDAGLMPSVVVAKPPDGFTLDCACCDRPFLSRGWKCCSVECGRSLRKRATIAETMAEVGMEASVRRKCQECGGDIPRWTGTGKKRRQVPNTTRFCSPKCRNKSHRVRHGQNVAEGAKNLQPSPSDQNHGLQRGEPQKPLQHRGQNYRVIAGPASVCVDCGVAPFLPRRGADGKLRCAECHGRANDAAIALAARKAKTPPKAA
jgi:ribosomal protein L24E